MNDFGRIWENERLSWKEKSLPNTRFTEILQLKMNFGKDNVFLKAEKFPFGILLKKFHHVGILESALSRLMSQKAF